MPNDLADLVSGVVGDRTGTRSVPRAGGTATSDTTSGLIGSTAGAGFRVLSQELWPPLPNLPNPYTGEEPKDPGGATEILGWTQTGGSKSSASAYRIYGPRGTIL